MPTVTRVGYVWDEILVKVDGLGAARREKCAQSQGFDQGVRGGGERRTGIIDA